MHQSIIDEIVEQLRSMPQHLQGRVLDFTQMLVNAQMCGTPGHQLLQFSGSIPLDDLKLMTNAIKQDCDQVDWNEW